MRVVPESRLVETPPSGRRFGRSSGRSSGRLPSHAAISDHLGPALAETWAVDRTVREGLAVAKDLRLHVASGDALRKLRAWANFWKSPSKLLAVDLHREFLEPEERSANSASLACCESGWGTRSVTMKRRGWNSRSSRWVARVDECAADGHETSTSSKDASMTRGQVLELLAPAKKL